MENLSIKQKHENNLARIVAIQKRLSSVYIDRKDNEEGELQQELEGLLKEVKEYSYISEVKINKEINEYIPAISHSEFIKKEYPPAKYIIEPLVEMNAMNMISAPPNGWKSWFLFLFAGHISTGTLVFNKFKTERTNVMILNEEDIPSLVQGRLKMLGFNDPSLPIYYRIAQGAKLSEEFVDNLILECKEKSIGVIMFDSLRAIHDADENSSKEMQVVLDLFKKINRENITVIFTHHHKKKNSFGKNDNAEMSRGSTAINASISGHISLEEINKEDGKSLVVKHLKSKAGAKLDDFDIAIKITDHIFSFEYLGDHQPKEQALNEAKTGILYELENREELLGRKDFLQLKIAGSTSIKEATKFLVKEGKIKEITRKEAEVSGLKILGPGKSNEKLYFLNKEEDSDFDVFDQPSLDSS